MAQENITDVIDKRFGDSLTHFLKLVDPERRYKADLKMSKAWSRLSLNDQRRLYLYLLYRKWRGEGFYGTPYEIVNNCHPYPTNWNGHPMVERLLKEHKMVSAMYQGLYGVYTVEEAKVWQMTDVKPKNFR